MVRFECYIIMSAGLEYFQNTRFTANESLNDTYTITNFCQLCQLNKLQLNSFLRPFFFLINVFLFLEMEHGTESVFYLGFKDEKLTVDTRKKARNRESMLRYLPKNYFCEHFLINDPEDLKDLSCYLS